jgi:hypothetical protein
MPNAKCKIQNTGGRFAATLAFALVLFVYSSVAFADGGLLRLSQRCGQWQVSVFTSPAMPRVGPIDISTFVQEVATGHARDDVPVIVRSQSVERPGLTLEQEATASAATNKLFRAAVINIPEAGKWRAEILIGGESHWTSNGDRNFPTLAFDFDVASPPAEWLSLAAWVSWPMGVVAIFLAHQILVVRSASKRLPGSQSGKHQNYVDTV